MCSKKCVQSQTFPHQSQRINLLLRSMQLPAKRSLDITSEDKASVMKAFADEVIQPFDQVLQKAIASVQATEEDLVQDDHEWLKDKESDTDDVITIKRLLYTDLPTSVSGGHALEVTMDRMIQLCEALSSLMRKDDHKGLRNKRTIFERLAQTNAFPPLSPQSMEEGLLVFHPKHGFGVVRVIYTILHPKG